MDLSKYISSIVYKILATVDLKDESSNQHEINGVDSLKQFFQTDETINGIVTWHYFADGEDPESQTGNFTFYDARKKSFDRTGRSEWRMYYEGDFIRKCDVGDVLLLIRLCNDQIHGLLFENNSRWLVIATDFFRITDLKDSLSTLSDQTLSSIDLTYYTKKIIDELDLEIPLPVADDDFYQAEKLLADARKVGLNFPQTRTMNKAAQDLVEVDIEDSDKTLITWLDKEERLFRAIEKILVEDRLKSGFVSVDDFISYSLSVQNRRKSRMGFALQNHLSEIFTRKKVKFSSQRRTEGKNTPDFIFPGIAEYKNEHFDSNFLSMLAAKSSCKERWAQILTEAARISTKHLCTVDLAISSDQVDKIYSNNIILVIPNEVSMGYSEKERMRFWNLNKFVEYVLNIQQKIK